MANRGRRHMLIIYKYMLDRWAKAILTMGVLVLFISAGFAFLPLWLPQLSLPWIADWRLWVSSGVGGFTVVFALFLIAIRKSAYVQAYEDHLRLVTPFLKLNISYKRVIKTTPVELHRIIGSNKSLMRYRKILGSLINHTSIVIEMRGMPASRQMLRLFLSPLFFPDKTSSLALVVPDWVALSTELDSLRSAWQEGQRRTRRDPTAALLSSLK